MVHFQTRYRLAIDLILLVAAFTIAIIAAVRLDPTTTFADIFAVAITLIGIFLFAWSYNSTPQIRLIQVYGIIAIFLGVVIGASHTAPKKKEMLLVYIVTKSECTLLIQPNDGAIHTTQSGDWNVLKLTFYSQDEFETKLHEAKVSNKLENCNQITLP